MGFFAVFIPKYTHINIKNIIVNIVGDNIDIEDIVR
jgi:hypothetical protein